jgi:hypothetical protein
MEPEGLLPHSEVPATCPYPEPARTSPYPHIPLPEEWLSWINIKIFNNILDKNENLYFVNFLIYITWSLIVFTVLHIYIYIYIYIL